MPAAGPCTGPAQSICTGSWQFCTVSAEHTLGSAHRQHSVSGPSQHHCALIRAASTGPVPRRGVGSPLLEPAPPSSGTAHPPWQPPRAGVWEVQQRFQWSCGHAEPGLGSCRGSVTDGVGNGMGEVAVCWAGSAMGLSRGYLMGAQCPSCVPPLLHYLLDRGLLPSLLFLPDAPSLY